jgi:hypothetical protein
MRDGGTPNSLWQRGTQLTCFSGTKVQILPEIIDARFMRDGGTPHSPWQRGAQLICSTGTEVQILPEILGARCTRDMATRPMLSGNELLSFLTLLVQ